MGAFLKKYIDPLVPLWAIVPLVTCFVFNCAIYWVTMALCADLYHYDFTLEIDRMVPVITEWIYIYLGYSYVFWALGYCYMAHVHRDNPVEIFRFVTADVMSRIVCLLFFIFLPTTNVRPEILGNDISDQLTRFLYSIDEAANLFPSIHCLVSWLCFIGIRSAKNVSLFAKLFSLISAILIMISTQVLKQHYIVDMISGIALAEICYFISGHIRLKDIVFNWYKKLVLKKFPKCEFK